MNMGVTVKSEMLEWAIQRAGFNVLSFTEKNQKVGKWISGEKTPTVKQLEEFSKKVHLPFGFLLLNEPPTEQLPFTLFRTGKKPATRVNVNVYDTILLLQKRQDWLRDYLIDHEFETLPFVGKYNGSNNILDIVADIRATLELQENWASEFRTWEEAQNHLVTKIEDKGIIVVFNGIVENNTSRKIEVDDCRGFVLVDKIAPFMFINNSDFKSAQMFTLAHELAHIWTGHSAGFDNLELRLSDDPNEILCDKIAAEFLVPENAFNAVWDNDVTKAARHFKVSEIVIARRALDLGKLSKSEFFTYYNSYKQRALDKKNNQEGGGSFYANVGKRISITFAVHVKNAVNSGELLFRDAYKLTSLNGETFHNYFETK